MKTFGQILDDYRGIGPGFDFLRVFLALAIVAVHTFSLTSSAWMINDTPFWFTRLLFVPMFFALSGFLITGSGMRLSLKNFLLNRGMRIVPALAVDIALCALILGPIVTTVALSEYFTSKEFYTYFLNIVGWVHYKLPGVFEYYPNSKVNGSLWTVPYEILCYIFISGLMITKSLHRPLNVLIVTLVYFGIGAVLSTGLIIDSAPGAVRNALRILFLSEGSRIITAFLIGIMIFQLRHKIPYSKALFAACVLLCFIAPVFMEKKILMGFAYRPIFLIAICYMTVFLGLTAIAIPKFFKGGDYSYGIYLYHYPMIHIINISGIVALGFNPLVETLLTYVLAVILVIGVAYISWHYIEKPTLALRKKFSFIAKERGIEAVK